MLDDRQTVSRGRGAPPSRVRAVRGTSAGSSSRRRIQLLSLAVALLLAALALLLGGALFHPAPAAATDPADIKPHIVKKLIPFGNSRVEQTKDYCERHYDQHTYELTSPKAIVLHHTAGSTWQSAWNTFAANTAYNDEKPGVSAHFIITKRGRIIQCVRLSYRARHCIGMNWASIGIEFVQEPREGEDGHWMDRQILNRAKQVKAGLRLVRYLRLRFHIKKANIVGHATANGSPYFKDLTGIKNAAGDWYAAEVKLFRRRL